MMRRDREQRFGELADTLNQKILNVLRCEDNGAVLFTDTLHGVSDVFDRRHICQK